MIKLFKLLIMSLVVCNTIFAGVYYTVDDAGNVTRHKKDTPYPTNAIIRVDAPSGLDVSLLKVVDGVIAGKPMHEVEAMRILKEQIRQNEKPDSLKSVENNFYDLCFALFGDFNKRGFNEIRVRISAIQSQNPMQAIDFALKLLAIDAEGKREGGDKWWDDAIRH